LSQVYFVLDSMILCISVVCLLAPARTPARVGAVNKPKEVAVRVAQSAAASRDVRVAGVYIEAAPGERRPGAGSVGASGRVYKLVRSVYDCWIERRLLDAGPDVPPAAFWVIVEAGDQDV
jgi:hypothetical protein